MIRLGVTSSTVILTVSIVLGGFIGKLSGGIFEYIQSLYAFFVTPFATVFILGRKAIDHEERCHDVDVASTLSAFVAAAPPPTGAQVPGRG